MRPAPPRRDARYTLARSFAVGCEGYPGGGRPLPDGRDSRRRALTAIVASMAAVIRRPAVAADPRGTVRLVLGFAPGGTGDRVARVLAPELARASGRETIVENLPGANGARAIARVAASEPDATTMLVGTSAVAHPDHAAAMAALRPVALLSTSSMMLVVRASLPAHDPAAFARLAKSRDDLAYGSAGEGNATHLCAAELLQRIGARAIHAPYTGGGAALKDLLGGHIDFLMTGTTATLLRQPAARVLAVTSAERSRLPGLDHLPTLGETIADGFEYVLWQAIYVPAATPDALVADANARLGAALARDEVRAALAAVGAEAAGGSPEDAARRHLDEVGRFRRAAARSRQ